MFCDLGAMLKVRAVLKLSRVGWRPMTDALERTPSSWAARLEAMAGVGVAMIICCGSKKAKKATTVSRLSKMLFGKINTQCSSRRRELGSGQIIADVTLREQLSATTLSPTATSSASLRASLHASAARFRKCLKFKLSFYLEYRA